LNSSGRSQYTEWPASDTSTYLAPGSICCAKRPSCERGYAATTLQAIAERADVAVETLYKRFGNKRALLAEVRDLAVVGESVRGSFPAQVSRLPEFQALQKERDQRLLLRHLAAFSRATLDRAAPIQRISRSAAAADPGLEEFLESDRQVRRQTQRTYIDLLLARGPLRPGLSVEEAAETYSALANPELHDLLTRGHGWTSERYETWLADSLNQLLLADS
jgi:AcrR family transcriptional regulator